jgi:hypothetical protein
MSQVYVSYPPGPLVRQGRDRRGPRAGQRMPDIRVRAGGQATTLHGALRGGRHVLVAPAAAAASVLNDPQLRRYQSDLDIATVPSAPGDNRTRLFVLIRPDGHIAAHGRPGSMGAITGYLRDLFSEPACHPGDRPEGMTSDFGSAAAANTQLVAEAAATAVAER